jgi:hypothetical protein
MHTWRTHPACPIRVPHGARLVTRRSSPPGARLPASPLEESSPDGPCVPRIAAPRETEGEHAYLVGQFSPRGGPWPSRAPVPWTFPRKWCTGRRRVPSWVHEHHRKAAAPRSHGCRARPADRRAHRGGQRAGPCASPSARREEGGEDRKEGPTEGDARDGRAEGRLRPVSLRVGRGADQPSTCSLVFRNRRSG